jgi:hypothetical protein
MTNPFLGALKWTGLVTLAVGLLLLIIGGVTASQQTFNIFSGPAGFAGLPQLILGAVLAPIGLFGVFLWLHGAAILWKPTAELPAEDPTAKTAVFASTESR